MIERLEQAAQRPVSRETFERLQIYIEMLRREARQQNLVSRGTLDDVWDRHILDSAQLARFEPKPASAWLDIGSGAGLPGVVLACLVDGPVTLIEPRRLRAQFLTEVVDALALRATVIQSKAERAAGRFDVITGRAVAHLDDFLRLSAHLSTRNTVWALPKGRNAQSELADAKRAWQGVFHVEQSITDADSWIIVGSQVRAKQQ